jgi:putative hydrolase of the HAD superfamily
VIGAALPATDIVVLDAHGVVFNRAFPAFVRGRATERGDDPDAVWGRWRNTLRIDFWEGRIAEPDMWASLFPGDVPEQLSADLERGFEPGPLFEVVATSTQRLWMLSNHRSDWLLPRLDRFGIADRFERVIVSDRLGVAKPDPAVFAPLIEAMRDHALCFIDDSPANVAAARAVGIDAVLPSLDPPAGADDIGAVGRPRVDRAPA